MDREQRLAAAKKKLNIYKQQQQQSGQGQQQQAQSQAVRRPSNTSEPSPSTSSSSSSSHAGQISPAVQAASSVFNGNGTHHHHTHNNELVAVPALQLGDHQQPIAHAHQQHEVQPVPFPVGLEPGPPPPLPPLILPLDVPPQQLDLLDSNPLLPHPTAHFDLLDSNTLPPHSIAQSSPGPSSSSGGMSIANSNAIPARDIVETHQHQGQSSSGSNSNVGHIFNHDIVADINNSYNYNNGGNGLMAFVSSGPSALPDVASDAPPPAAVTPGLIEDSQPQPQLVSPNQREMEQDLISRVNQVNQQGPPSPLVNDLIATATVSSSASAFNSQEPSSSSAKSSIRRTARSPIPVPTNTYPMPTFRRSGQQSGGGSASSSISGMEDINAAASAVTTEVYELQLSQLRSDNAHLQQRETDLVNQLQQVELTIQSLRRERDDLRQELRADDSPSLKTKLNTLYDENARLKQQIGGLEMQLGAAHEDVNIKMESYNELEQALIVINKGKMELAAKLDVESEVSKDLRARFDESQHQLAKLSERNIELESILSSHQLQLERLSSLETEMILMRKKYGDVAAAAGDHHHEHHAHEHEHEHQDHNHTHEQENHEEHHHDHKHEHNAECSHDHDHKDEPHNHSHDHENHDHHHNHDHEGHDHHHDHEHTHDEDQHQHAHATSPKEDPTSLSALQKKLARLEWENSSFREEIDRLAELLRTKTVDSNLLSTYQEDNERLKRSLNQAEHLVVQLSSENETIGDYIALYQTQRLALKERAREKENEMASLTVEREKLRAQMEQLNQLLQAYHCKLEEGTAAGEIEANAKQINELVLGINSTFNPCSSCSGSRLMNV